MSERKKKQKFKQKKRKNKLVLIFDENARREFLTGFHKRKIQRRNKAMKEFEMQLKCERKRIKSEAREQYKKMLLAQKPIPDLEYLLSKEIDMGTHSVTVTELSTSDLAKKNNWIGVNEVQYEEEWNKEKSNENDIQLQKIFEYREAMETGKDKKMDLSIKTKKPKDIKKVIKQQATLNVKNSKIYKKKVIIEKVKNNKIKQKKLKKKIKDLNIKKKKLIN